MKQFFIATLVAFSGCGIWSSFDEIPESPDVGQDVSPSDMNESNWLAPEFNQRVEFRWSADDAPSAEIDRAIVLVAPSFDVETPRFFFGEVQVSHDVEIHESEQLFWVNVPGVLARRSGAITMYFDSESATDGGSAQVWSDYLAVWNFDRKISETVFEDRVSGLAFGPDREDAYDDLAVQTEGVSGSGLLVRNLPNNIDNGHWSSPECSRNVPNDTTFEFWFNLNTEPANPTLFALGPEAPGGGNYIRFTAVSGGPVQVVAQGAGQNQAIEGSDFRSDEWRHVAVSVTSNPPTMTYYENGESVGFFDLDSNWSFDNQGCEFGPQPGIDGAFDTFRVKSSASSADQVKFQYLSESGVLFTEGDVESNL